jgi:hypothetical protein
MVDEDQHNEITDSKYFKELQNQIRFKLLLKAYTLYYEKVLISEFVIVGIFGLFRRNPRWISNQ